MSQENTSVPPGPGEDMS